MTVQSFILAENLTESLGNFEINNDLPFVWITLSKQ